MTTLQRPGWTPMAQIPPDQTNRGGDGWRGLDWWDSPTRVADTPVWLRVGVLPSNEGVNLQMAMDGGMRLATGCFKFMDAIHRRMFLLQPSSTFATAFGAPSLRQPSLGSTLTPSQLEQQPPSEIAPSGNAATASSGGTR
ncbi:hypothetical protein CTAM01_11204 [Colletotrichum tamarilloi]|uniref:Uncharacterized protein n=1 Tax=Colletotrichum tamarilloi TaxID=1209934 RepID=A0ABQ9QY31_9PEZI|nr:uncharacterized protein CTAM01_11204 [Colletotrichum tamarilloi]KAK1489055.1 hypothetical protein CTAM01_11204 [Colletotrichum tamarilloi]